MRTADAWKKWISTDAPDAPSIVWTYPTPKRALLIRTQYAEPPANWGDTAGVRAVDVIALDAKPSAAKRALIEYREGKTFRKVWVELSALASTEAAALEKLAPHFSALLSSQRLEKKPVTTNEGKAEAFPTAEAAA